MKILAIDTSNQTMAVAVTEDQRLLGQLQTTVNKNHSKTLMPAIETLMRELDLTPQALDRIVVAQGPGSYTGLRIGVTTAKTLADTLNIELVGVSSLATVAGNCVGRNEWIVPLFDARRQNVYAGAYQWQQGQLVNVLPEQHIALDALLTKLQGQEVYFVGEDVQKFQEIIAEKIPTAICNTVLAWNYPSGVVLAELGKQAPVVDAHPFLPNYLKRVEAEEKWLESHEIGEESYVEKI
ncbi:tRNA (adenosine(37)-N6)-threonylcarbamoyltransferase complex dimerization subunit type 1 TsaB [Enterococcus saccharolyticus]|uniref:Universal bacterial protein YeaZ n=1 Tax=Enterococcus saccharolyticus subsp. saccharolyticus ATCC 43076 TaxID=1139996 RepID=S0NUD0_9ENTE|nr:tRNA (adenosine(37)-N6)-threonylcarbamoyltransferase complex dimerization subunit type 1 TsaB [Enterococcus saccharolyticus]EOT28514.1 universal bacterial protein YeaZ [Enterococcus saccharolyticus subsp. saccharolyticus ATCC 43076]EOT81505.1 universal bacterial protein YeaZ [Enterococcus saccharolyticus subsp. saccharolyticus ATCC 43076]OJG87196.1 universal bacterial protein YeaZ [Enterococcus saccharolyticus]